MREHCSCIGWLGLAGLAIAELLATAACSDPVAHEVCGNWMDDNGNLLIDCADPECASYPACYEHDGDADVDGDGDTDADTDGDGDGDADADGDNDQDGDADVDEDPCDPDTEVCDFVCALDDDCELALDMLECCGGYPHDVGGTMVACPTAVHSDRVERSECVVPWAPTDPLPTVPEACTPWCEGVTCGECPALSRAACDPAGECVGVGADDGCVVDGDCPEGSACVDPDHDGVLQCVEGEHECETSDDCLAAHPTCAVCDCMDIDVDALRECSCYGCEGIECFQDLECDLHYFCDENLCVFGGNAACRVAGGAAECEPCDICEPSESNPARGRCVRDPAC
jgi:hypothetical protein